MKRLLLVLCILHYVMLGAQEVKQIQQDKCQFYVVSPNANCFAGATDGGPANFYRFSDDYFYQSNSIFASFITDKGEMASSFNGDAAIWTLGTDDYLTFQSVEGGNVKGRVLGFSKDFSSILISKQGYYVYEKHDDGLYHGTQIFLPQKDSIYHLAPQHVNIKGFSGDGRRIVGRFMNSDGQRETPFIIEKNEQGEWTTRFIGVGNLLHEGCIMPERPVRDGDTDPTYNARLMEYYEVRATMETGIYYELSNMTISENGKYLAVNVPMMSDGEAYQMIYAGVIDIDNDTLYIFKSVPDACCPAVSNYGEASICTPALAYLRQTYIGSIADVDNPKLLVDWVKEKTKGRLDLSEEMTFTSNSFGDTDVLCGSALISAEGNGFVSFVVDEWNTGKIYNFLVKFGSTIETSLVECNSDSFVYPNPVRHTIYFNREMSNIRLFDVAGRLVYRCGGTVNSLDLSKLKGGVYVLIACGEEGEVSEKIIVR